MVLFGLSRQGGVSQRRERKKEAELRGTIGIERRGNRCAPKNDHPFFNLFLFTRLSLLLSLSPRYRYPYVTGTSVLGLVFDGGVMLASDTLGKRGR